MFAEEEALYGFKQPLRVWYGKLCSGLVQADFKRNSSNHTVLVKRRKPGNYNPVYMDDIIVSRDDKTAIL